MTVQPANTAAGRSDNARSAVGVPDLTGVYGNAGLPPGTTAPPLKPGAEKFQIVRGANDIRGRTTLTTGNDCKPLGIPQTYITPYPFQIIQLPKQVVIIYEYPNAIRWIETIIWAAVLTLFCSLLFPYGLNLPLQLWPRF